MSVFIGDKTKRVELAERKDAINPNLFTGSKDFTGSKWANIPSDVSLANVQKDKYLDFTAILVNWQWGGISQYIDVKAGETFTASAYVKAKAGTVLHWYTDLNTDGEGGHKRADVSPVVQDIAVTDDWQRTSLTFTFTVTSDGTIKPRIEGDGSVPFWIAGMKLEKGAVATDWCPALEDYAWESDITNLQNTVNNIDSTRTPIVAGASDDDLFAFKTNQIRLYSGNGSTCKNLPPASNTQWFTVQYIFETPNRDGIAIYRTPYSEIWTAGCNGESYTYGWTRVANSTDVTNLQSMITGLSTKVDSLQQNSLKMVPITQADYDALSTKDPNTIYAIGG